MKYPRRLPSTLLLTSLACLLWSGHVVAATATLTPSKDNTIYGNGNANLSNGAGAFLFAGSSGENRILRGLVAFNVSQIPAGSTINSVTLRLAINTPLNNANTVRLHRVTADWGEGTSVAPMGGGGGAPATNGDATWNSRFFNTTAWTTPGGDFSSTASASQSVSGTSGTATFTSAGMVADVQAWVNSPSANFGWILVAQDEAGPAVRFASREGSPAPVLEIDFTAGAGSTAPGITAQPASQTIAAGGSVTFTVAATGSPAPTFQWRKDNVAITGATSASLTLTSLTAANAGRYSVIVTNSAGTVTSADAVLTITATPPPPPPGSLSWLSNLSILTSIGSAGDNFTMGYVVGGAGTSGAKPLVIRAVGPSLGALGVPGTLADPKLELFAGSAKTGENDNWGGVAAVSAGMAAVGAFSFTGGTSLDAAVLASITTRDNSVKVSAANTGTGTVIAEVYDATPAASFSATTPRLLNVSVLKNIGTSLTAGFVIGGTAPKTVLIRAVGPTLNTAFGITGVVANPQLVLFGAGATRVGENDNWGGTAQLTAAFTAVGAFALPATSQDAALLATLNPGDYSVVVTGVGGTTGTGLVEVYDVP